MILIRNNDVRIHNIGGHCVLMPGINEVEDKAWDEVIKLKASSKPLQFLMDGDKEHDAVIVMESKSSSKKKDIDPEQPAILALNERDAVQAVKDTLSVKTLESWGMADKRAQVLQAIDRQLKTLKEQPDQKKEKE